MNIKDFFTKNWYYLAILLSFIVVGFIYFSPVIKGMSLPQMDDIHAKGMGQELAKHKEATGEDAMWTNSMFGGMPAYQINAGTSHSIFLHIHRLLRMKLPYGTVPLVFFYLTGVFVLLRSLKVDLLLSIAGAVAFAFGSYNIIIIAAGHITKAYAIGCMAPAIAGMILLYRGKYISGALLALVGIGLEVASNHPQIFYYQLLIMAALFISETVIAAMKSTWATYAKASGILAIAIVLGVLPNITSLATTYEYGKETIRGGSDLKKELSAGETGLDKGYALSWSYGVAETATILIPDFHGGSSTEGFDTKSKTYKTLVSLGARQAEQIANSVAYWGDMPFTSGPVYFGAIIIFFFVLGLFIVENRYRWWILGATLLSVFLSWGKHFGFFTDFVLEYLPFYNKFRTVSMSLVMANLLMVLLAILAIHTIYNGKRKKDDLKRYAIITFGIVGGFCLLFVLIPGVFFDFQSMNDRADLPPVLLNAIESDRESALRGDAFRSLVFSVLSFGLAWLLIDNKIKNKAFGVLLIVLMFADLWPVAKRYLDADKFVKKGKSVQQFHMTDVDKFILKDRDPHFRVFNLTRNPWNDAYTSFYHKSLGGYHGAKLSRYQDLIERQLSRNNQEVVNMLNAKYIITADKKTGQPVANINFSALGNAWFVNDVNWVKGANAEMNALDAFNPEKTAVVDSSFAQQLEGLKEYDFFAKDTGTIALKEYRPDYLAFETDNKNEQLAVFSEIYYKYGWNAYIDGELHEHLRANYVLRALIVPAGQHKVEWKFEPTTYTISQTVALASSILVGLIILGLIFLLLKEAAKNEPEIESAK